MTDDYRLPAMLEPDLARVRGYWEGLKRGGNAIPFWDDIKFSQQTRVARETMLIEVFENPQRLRFDLVGDDVAELYGSEINGKFADEIDLHQPFDAIDRQCRITVERAAPTYYRREIKERANHGYSRLILPLWGNGRIEMLLAAVAALQ